MDFNQEYEKMRPYRDDEVPDVLKRVLADERFRFIIAYLYGADKVNDVYNSFRNIKTVAEFQSKFSHYAVREIIKNTSNGLTYSGLDKLDKNKPYLFITNHRDIVLDSAIMQILLVENNHKTSQITFGSNLMTEQFIIDIGKLNKMFNFYRGGSRMEMYNNAMLHSLYIQKVITEEHESIWIAQRDGRTKDGDDKTQTTLIKMFTMGKKKPYVAIKELNIIPVAISYEYEPCDRYKVWERYISARRKYKKGKNEDMNSVLSGITNHKGHIHMAFGEPIISVIDRCEKENSGLNGLSSTVASEIDRQIYLNYKLRAVNYIAYDILKNSKKYKNKEYTDKEEKSFVDYINSKIMVIEGDKTEFSKMFYKMYANPVINKLNMTV